MFTDHKMRRGLGAFALALVAATLSLPAALSAEEMASMQVAFNDARQQILYVNCMHDIAGQSTPDYPNDVVCFNEALRF